MFMSAVFTGHQVDRLHETVTSRSEQHSFLDRKNKNQIKINAN